MLSQKAALTLTRVLVAVILLFGIFSFLFGLALLATVTEQISAEPVEGYEGWIYLLLPITIIGGLMCTLFGIFTGFTFWLAWKRKEAGRILSLIVSILLLPFFPIGSVIGAVGIWLFGFEKRTQKLFR